MQEFALIIYVPVPGRNVLLRLKAFSFFLGNAPRHADSYLSPLEDAYFTIALGSSVQLIKLGKVGQVPVFCELSYGSLVGRIWGGLMPGALR